MWIEMSIKDMVLLLEDYNTALSNEEREQIARQLEEMMYELKEER